MAKIPKNLSDKDMMVNFKEELTFENMFSDEPEVKKVQKKDKENLNTAFFFSLNSNTKNTTQLHTNAITGFKAITTLSIQVYQII